MFAPFRQDNTQRRARDFGIRKEQLVKVAHSIKQQAIGVRRLNLEILRNHRRGGAPGKGDSVYGHAAQTSKARRVVAPGRFGPARRWCRNRHHCLWNQGRRDYAIEPPRGQRKDMAEETPTRPNGQHSPTRKRFSFTPRGGRANSKSLPPSRWRRSAISRWPIRPVSRFQSRLFTRTLDGFRLHRTRQSRRGHHQWNGHFRPRQSRRPGGQAGDGRKSRPVQAIRRY